jgi:hypothetical protein
MLTDPGDRAALVPGTDMAVMHGFEAGVGTDCGSTDSTSAPSSWSGSTSAR